MARRRSSGFPSRGAARRQTSWNQGPAGLTAVISTSAASVTAVGSQAVRSGLTLVRTRGHWTIDSSVQADFPGTFFEMALGLAIVTENAAGIGITAVPYPLTDIGWDGWLWHWVGVAPIVPGMGGASGLSPVSIEVDAKVMRKWKETDVMIAVMEVAETGTAGDIQAHFNSRVLVKLP